MRLRTVLASMIISGLASQALAQAPAPPPPPQPPAAPQAAQGEEVLSSAQLDALVAPIALYPDTLLAQVLMAATYPLEVVQADRWLTANKKLKGDQLKAAVDKQPWDASVKSLVATPAVLEMMSKNLDWTQRLGDAVLAQQSDLMDGIQRMRTRAYDAKKLSSGSQQTVTVRQDSGKQTILIEPTNPGSVYVPYYDPAVVYGTWPYPAYPPYYFPAPGYIAPGLLATGLAFGTAYALGRWVSGGYWGGNVNWVGGGINIDRDRVTHWQHDPQHRHGVQYRNDAVRQKFANSDIRAGSADRMDFRGRSGDQVLRPEGDAAARERGWISGGETGLEQAPAPTARAGIAPVLAAARGPTAPAVPLRRALQPSRGAPVRAPAAPVRGVTMPSACRAAGPRTCSRSAAMPAWPACRPAVAKGYRRAALGGAAFPAEAGAVEAGSEAAADGAGEAEAAGAAQTSS